MNYYNDNDPTSAAWLRELIKQKVIPTGDVDERSIIDVTKSDVAGYTQCHFFAGIGGWVEALRLAEWPAERPVWTGSCPCQPFSCAGKHKGEKDERHLWPEFRRLIADCRPPIVFGEQVASKDGRLWLSGVRIDLENLEYAVGAADLCAAGVGAPHIRQRLYWLADAISEQNFATNTGGFHPESCGNSKLGRLGNTPSAGFIPSSYGNVYCGEESPGPWNGKSERSSDDDCGLDDANGNKHRGGSRQSSETDSLSGINRQTLCSGVPRGTSDSFNRMADTNGSGLPKRIGNQGIQSETLESSQREAVECRSNLGFWSNSIWLPCADGKARRTEPGIFPLADGIPGRVGLLRGYGNAIVPQVAAEFIKAYMDVTQ